MSFSVRTAEPDELESILRLDSTAFNYAFDPKSVETGRQFYDMDRLFVLEDDGEMVGTSCNLPLEVTLPGGATVPMTGVSGVCVLPTHHRRGGLSLMMEHLVADGREHGEPVAGLWASESIIYRRFGYGIASRTARTTIEVKRAGLRVAHEPAGTIHLTDKKEGATAFADLVDAYRRTRNGMVSRPLNIVLSNYGTPPLYPSGSHGKTEFVAIHRDRDGKTDGLIRYTVGDSPDWTAANAEVNVIDLIGLTPAVEIDLWMYAIGMDFAGSVTGWNRPLDEPIVDLLADPRRWRIHPRDGLHLRIADIDRMLSTRRYLREGEVVLEVVTPDGSRSRHRLTGGPDGASCATADDAIVDLTLDLASLGAILLGDTPVERLARAGVVEERTSGAVEQATAMFLWSAPPWPGYVF